MSIDTKVRQLVALVEAGQITEAIETFYAPDVAMQENLAPAVVGREANIARERAFFGSITLHQNTARSVIVGKDGAVINWLLDFTGGDGKRYVIDELAIQQWKDGRIIHERYVYDSASIANERAAA
jgi:hypothetical protein